MTIKSKLFSGFAAMFLLLVIVASILIFRLTETNRSLNELVDLFSRKVGLSGEMLANVLEAARHEKNIIIETNPVEILKYEQRLRVAMQNVDQNILTLTPLVDGEGEQLLLQFKDSWSTYKNDIEEIITLALDNKNQDASKISLGRGFQVRETVIATLNLLVEKNQNAMAESKARSDENYRSAMTVIIVLVVISLIIAVLIAFWIINGISRRISFISKQAEIIAAREAGSLSANDSDDDELSSIYNSIQLVKKSFAEITDHANLVASGNYEVKIIPRSDQDLLGKSLEIMTRSLREKTLENSKHNWLSSGLNLLNEKLRGDQSLVELSNNTISFICEYLDAGIGAIFLANDENSFELTGQYAFFLSESPQRYKLGEGLIGQAAVEKKPIFLNGVQTGQTRLISSIIDAEPLSVCVIPFVFEGNVLGVCELGRLNEFKPEAREFLLASADSIAIAINSAIARKRIQLLLEETQVQSEELQSQQEELRQINEELEEQAQSLKQQQEELQITNEELEEQTQALEAKNHEVAQAKLELEEKSRQLEISSRYKSEFLANMSHELRTPLNSLLILSKDLWNNKEKNLTPDQLESCEIIYKCGHDLLALINEVLDLSKIEAGKMNLNLERLVIENFVNDIYRNFKSHAEGKGLAFNVSVAPDVVPSIVSDTQRLSQIIKNLLSNAIKFTEKGEVKLSVYMQNDQVAFSVSDTGIGIPEDKQLAIFEAFQQADGGTSRKYGGTGLGLSISRELTRLLKGHLSVKSTVNKGSEFTLMLPLEIDNFSPAPQPDPVTTHKPAFSSGTSRSSYFDYPHIEDDRELVSKGDRVVLIVEDDLSFATILRNQARSKGFRALAATTGEDGLNLAEKYLPSAIILDIDLPGMNGNQVLAELKASPKLRHIPVHIISVNERSIEPIKNGAVEYLTKPVDQSQIEDAFARIEDFINRKMKNLLIIEDDAGSMKAIQKLIGNGDVKTLTAATGQEAIKLFSDNHVDCIVMDIGLPDISGFDLIHKLLELNKGMPPVIVYTGRELTRKENEELQKYSETIIIKGTKSEERLLDETALFLHRAIENLPEPKQKMISGLYDQETLFHSKKILLVDDDMRNVFALSKILKDHNMIVVKADNGLVALEELENHPDVDLILMDIMMPEMDGYEATRRIRSDVRFRDIPIISLTAKAMKEDRNKCIEAGANDYITKPIEVDRILSLMRVWLSK